MGVASIFEVKIRIRLVKFSKTKFENLKNFTHNANFYPWDITKKVKDFRVKI